MTQLGTPPKEVRPISADIDRAQLTIDLERLVDQAVKNGAQNASIVNRQEIFFNPELIVKTDADNDYPSIHWPLTYPNDELQDAIDAFEWAVFFRIPIDETMPAYGGGPILNESHRCLYLKTYEIVTEIESTAFYMGYHLTIGLAAGNCRAVFCKDENRCWPLLKGQACVRPNMGRPSMEAAGIDSVAMAKYLKWQLPKSTLHPILAGLVLIT
jgi:predicted metal-binding protein